MQQEYGTVEYVEKVTVKLEEEVAWASKILKEESIVKVRTAFIHHFITNAERRVSSECKQMIAEEQNGKLAAVYKFMKYNPDCQFEEIKTNLKNHIEKEVLASVSNLKGNDVHTTFIKNLLDYHTKYQDMVQNVFDNDPPFVAVFDQTFHHVINHKTIKDQNISSAEMLAKRCDTLLLTTKMSEGEVDKELSHTFNTIFQYIDEGDEFENFYMKLLAKRLLQNTVQSMELEEKMVKIFMKTCGFGYSNKLTTMLMDIRLSADITNRFTQKNKKIGFGFAVKIPKCSVWPISQKNVLNLPLPGVIETTMHLFEGFYNENFSGRKLKWMNHLSSNEININVKRTYMVTMNTFQMAILWLFQNTDDLSFSSIKGSLGINGEILSKHISSLVKPKLLNCDTNVVGETSTLTFNVAFKKNLIKFKILGASTRVSPEEKEEVIKTLTEDRKYFLEAAVVRIMKHHKEMNHNDLVNEVFTQTKRKFTVHMPMLKKIIENLIEKEYLQRDATKTDVYQYLA
ncbi:cullin-2-like [Cloeon dipterum]|uniref:cullin-2-like n=1 Tax=Cloeon dipterum TaxID=197152 RepID=UPI0032200C45